MSPAERIYSFLLWLYPLSHRQAYGELMLQHVRDLEREVRYSNPRRLPWLYAHLIADGFRNASTEWMEAIMKTIRYTPASWLSVFLAAIPGLLLAGSRLNLGQLGSVLPILVRVGYLAVLVIGLPLIWYRQRRFPVWALLPAGLLFWFAVYLVGAGLTELLKPLSLLPAPYQDSPIGFALFQIVLTILLYVLLLRGKRIPASVWLTLGLMLVINLLAMNHYLSDLSPYRQRLLGIFQFLILSGIGPIEGLMLVGVGLLAVRRHGLLALLVVIGGFAYMCMDSDYFSGFRLNEWAGYNLYALSMVAIYLVVTPVALLRAHTRLGRALAVFIPIGLFHIARLVVPGMVLPVSYQLPWGDIFLSLNVLLSLVLAWFLYDHLSQEVEEAVLPVSSATGPEQPAAITPLDS